MTPLDLASICKQCIYLLIVMSSFPFLFSILPLSVFLSFPVCYLPHFLPCAGGCCALQSLWLRAVDHREACVSERLMDGL